MSKPKRQHFVPKALLRNFATDTNKIVVADRRNNKRILNSIDNVAVESHMYSPLEGGERNYDVENWFSKVETIMANIFREILVERVWPLRPDMRHALAQYISLQWSRTPATRMIHNTLADEFFSGSIRDKGKEWFKAIQGEGKVEASPEEIDASWDRLKVLDLSIFRYDVPWQNVAVNALSHGEKLAARQMSLMECHDWCLLTSDRAVAAFPRTDQEGRLSLGLFNTDLLFFPISRNVLVTVHDAEGEDFVAVPFARTFSLANMCLAMGCQRWLFHHPEDYPLTGIDLSAYPDAPSPIIR